MCRSYIVLGEKEFLQTDIGAADKYIDAVDMWCACHSDE